MNINLSLTRSMLATAAFALAVPVGAAEIT